MDKKVEIIAEIGKNFVISKNPEPLDILLVRAKTLIMEAKKAGATTVKFQVHCYEDEIHPDAKIVSPHFDQDRLEWVKRNSYPVTFWMDIADFCRQNKIEFLATPMSKNAAVLLDIIGVDRWKVGSGDILDFVLLDYIRDTGKPVILSSGMSTLEELHKAYDYLREKTKDVSILHCVSMYPCPLEKLNLLTIKHLKKEFPEAKIGFSDHSTGIEGSLMAVAMGAEIIEKHFSFTREAWGSDHKVSILPYEMEELCKRVKNKYATFKEIDGIMTDKGIFFPEALGVETKYLQEGEEGFRSVFRKGLYASRDIDKGEMFEQDSFYALRAGPSEALPSTEYQKLVGTLSTKAYRQYERI